MLPTGINCTSILNVVNTVFSRCESGVRSEGVKGI